MLKKKTKRNFAYDLSDDYDGQPNSASRDASRKACKRVDFSKEPALFSYNLHDVEEVGSGSLSQQATPKPSLLLSQAQSGKSVQTLSAEDSQPLTPLVRNGSDSQSQQLARTRLQYESIRASEVSCAKVERESGSSPQNVQDRSSLLARTALSAYQESIDASLAALELR
jgi:hypothetical protein